MKLIKTNYSDNNDNKNNNNNNNSYFYYFTIKTLFILGLKQKANSKSKVPTLYTPEAYS